MKKNQSKKIATKMLRGIAEAMLTSAANSRCVYVYHQPKQPKDVNRFRRF